MFAALDNLLCSLAFGGQRRQVQQYLDEATPESVLCDLSRELRYLGYAGQFRSIFQAWCMKKPSQSAHWTVKTFQAYLASAHPTISSAEIELLWRCFTFHTCHPFPQETDGARIGEDEFIRAATLLAVRGADAMGKVEKCDYYLHHDVEFYHRADSRRIFRSVSRPKPSDITDNDVDPDVVTDTMSVLTTVVPYFIHSGPSLDQLDSTARKLLHRHGSARTGRAVPREDFVTLLRLLLRTRLEKSTWGRGLHRGSFDTAEAADGVLADVLVAGVLRNSTGEDLIGEALPNIMDILPNIQIRFYQMWSLIFQPESAESLAQSNEPESVPARFLRAVSLFVPSCIVTSTGSDQLAQEDTRYILEPSMPPSGKEDFMPLTQLQDHLSSVASPHLVLCSNDPNSPQHTVLGAYFPGPLWRSSSLGFERKPAVATSSHLLLQLLPHFRILQWTGRRMPLADLLVPAGSSPDERTTTDKNLPLQPYLIGAPGPEGTHLRIDPETQIATLTHRVSPDNTGLRYQPIIGPEPGDQGEGEWMATVEGARIDIFCVTGPAESEFPHRYPDPYSEQSEADRVGGAELAGRIRGFGSDG